jgi:DNA repair exonuclease SbcCD ATPase subunit
MDKELSSRIASFHALANQAKQQLGYEEQNITRLHAKIAQIEKDKAIDVKAVGLIDRCIQIISANGLGKIESIVSAGLQQVFDDPSMGLVINKKDTARGSTYEFLMRQRDFIGKPMDSQGGGPVNIISLLLRLIMIKRFKLAKFLAFDESFNNVGVEDLPRVSYLLKTLSIKFGFTILAVTHQPILAEAADNMYRVVPTDGPPRLERIDRSGDAIGTEQEASATA